MKKLQMIAVLILTLFFVVSCVSDDDDEFWDEDTSDTYSGGNSGADTDTSDDNLPDGQQNTDPTTAPTDPTNPTTDPTEPTTDPTSDPTEPTSDPTEPTADPTDPTTDPTEPTADPTEPTADPTEPTTEPEPTEEEKCLAAGGTWGGGICTKEENCGSKPANTEWNGSGKFTQTFDGTGWAPAAKDAVYGEGECAYKCAENYFWNDTSCVNPCETDPCSEMDNATPGSCTTIDMTAFTCGCAAGHHWENSGCASDTRTVECTKPDHSHWNAATTPTVDQTWTSGEGWTPSTEGEYDPDETEGCYFSCDGTRRWDVFNKKCLGIPLGNICTGQQQCYGTTSATVTCDDTASGFFGQDAYYANYAETASCTAQSFEKTSDQIIINNNSGLEWTQENWTVRGSEAQSKCSSSDYAGKSAGYWRVPTLHELMTIVNNSKSSFAVDTAVFSTMPGSGTTMRLWSSNTTGNYNFALNLNHGLVSRESASGTAKNYLKCVHGDELPKASLTVSTVNEKEVVTDSTTGLMWIKEYKKYDGSAATKSTWATALAYCEDSDYAGYTDWRLPNKNELASLLDHTKTSAPYSEFPGIVYQATGSSFWTSSSYASTAGYAWKVDFYEGTVGGQTKTGTAFSVVCVRNAEVPGESD